MNKRCLIPVLAMLTMMNVLQANASPLHPMPSPPADVLAVTPQLYAYTRDVLFGQVWQRSELALRDRSIVTLAALLANGQSAQMTGHINLGLDNGLTPAEIMAITHMASDAEWPNALSATALAKEVFTRRGISLTSFSEPGELSLRDRSLVTIAALIARGQTDRLAESMNIGMDHGLTRSQIAELITHLAFYAGWPRAMSAVPVARQVFADRGAQP